MRRQSVRELRAASRGLTAESDLGMHFRPRTALVAERRLGGVGFRRNYQSLINLYLRECAESNRALRFG